MAAEAKPRLEEVLEKTLDEKSMEALITLAETAAKLKESGILDMLETIAEKYEELLLYTSSDHRVYHALAALEAVLTGLKKSDPWRYKPALEKMTECLVNAFDPETLQEARPVQGVFSLMKALRDPDVAKGLGVLIAIAKSLGRCVSSRT